MFARLQATKFLLVSGALTALLASNFPVRAATYPRPTQIRYIRVVATPTPLATSTRQPLLRRPLGTKPLPWWQQLWKTIGPAVLGSTGVLAGGLLTWYTLRRKTRAFDQYYQRIAEAQRRYLQTITNGMSESQAHIALKSELTGIQEEVELAVAQKKLDQEHLIAVSNKIQRILNTKE